MSKGDISGLSFLGRPIKPVALGLALYMLVVIYANALGTGRVTERWLTYVLVVTSSLAFILLVYGWIFTKQKVAEWGLFATTVTLLLRTSFLAFSNGLAEQAVWLTFSTTVVAGGAYLLETTDLHRTAQAHTRSTDKEMA